MAKRYVYSFDEVDQVEARAGDWKGVIALLGGKGGNLAAIAKKAFQYQKALQLQQKHASITTHNLPRHFHPECGKKHLRHFINLKK